MERLLRLGTLDPGMQEIRLATRGSDLARRQAGAVASTLESSRRTVEIVEVETRGDRVRDELIHRLGKTGAFVRALDERVLAGDADVAVHSLKDVPTEFPEGLSIAAVPGRASARDVLVTPDGRALEDLREGAVVGTSSLRRGAMLRAERPDLAVRPLRGNVDTRVEKLLAPTLQREHERRMEAAEEADDGAGEYDRTPDEWFDDLAEIERRALGRDVDVEEPYDAIVLAEAGLDRLGLAAHVPHEPLPPATFVPAPGQGALAVTARDEDADGYRALADHQPTRVAATVERVILSELGGGCIAPIGVHARVQGRYVRATARVLAGDGTEEVGASRDLAVERHPGEARAFARDLAERGATDLIERATREAGDGDADREEDA
jgi:hydroxymethylbilane synthase